jgi:hypothetical protein
LTHPARPAAGCSLVKEPFLRAAGARIVQIPGRGLVKP